MTASGGGAEDVSGTRGDVPRVLPSKEIIMRRFAVFAVLLALGCGLTATLVHAEDPLAIIAARQAGYKKMGKAFFPIKKALAAGTPVTAFADNAQVVIDWCRKIPTMFPPGTETGGKTHALPAVWTERPAFEKKAANLLSHAEKLKALALAGDTEGFKTQYAATGAVCDDCHKHFRSE